MQLDDDFGLDNRKVSGDDSDEPPPNKKTTAPTKKAAAPKATTRKAATTTTAKKKPTTTTKVAAKSKRKPPSDEVCTHSFFTQMIQCLAGIGRKFRFGSNIRRLFRPIGSSKAFCKEGTCSFAIVSTE